MCVGKKENAKYDNHSQSMLHRYRERPDERGGHILYIYLHVLLMYTAWGLTRVHWKELQTDISMETTIHTNIQNSSVVFSTEVG